MMSFFYIVCEDGDIRLIGGSSATNGIVEVCIAKEWGTVCADSWDLSDAQVVCRQLGYLESSKEEALNYSASYFTFWMEILLCRFSGFTEPSE